MTDLMAQKEEIVKELRTEVDKKQKDF